MCNAGVGVCIYVNERRISKRTSTLFPLILDFHNTNTPDTVSPVWADKLQVVRFVVCAFQYTSVTDKFYPDVFGLQALSARHFHAPVVSATQYARL